MARSRFPGLPVFSSPWSPCALPLIQSMPWHGMPQSYNCTKRPLKVMESKRKRDEGLLARNQGPDLRDRWLRCITYVAFLFSFSQEHGKQTQAGPLIPRRARGRRAIVMRWGRGGGIVGAEGLLQERRIWLATKQMLAKHIGKLHLNSTIT